MFTKRTNKQNVTVTSVDTASEALAVSLAEKATVDMPFIHVKAETMLEADTGYLGLAQIHPNSLLSKKRSKNHPLTKQQRRDNRKISRKRILVEHAICAVKRFRILSERYRNRDRKSVV